MLAVRLRLIIWHTPTSALILRYATDVRTIYGWLFSCQHEKQRWHPTCNALPEVLVCGGSDRSNLRFGCSDVRLNKRTELQLHLRRTWSPVVRRGDMPKSNAFVMGSGHLGLDWGCLREDQGRAFKFRLVISSCPPYLRLRGLAGSWPAQPSA